MTFDLCRLKVTKTVVYFTALWSFHGSIASPVSRTHTQQTSKWCLHYDACTTSGMTYMFAVAFTLSHMYVVHVRRTGSG